MVTDGELRYYSEVLRQHYIDENPAVTRRDFLFETTTEAQRRL
jgi:hypothetical protein